VYICMSVCVYVREASVCARMCCLFLCYLLVLMGIFVSGIFVLDSCKRLLSIYIYIQISACFEETEKSPNKTEYEALVEKLLVRRLLTCKEYNFSSTCLSCVCLTNPAFIPTPRREEEGRGHSACTFYKHKLTLLLILLEFRKVGHQYLKSWQHIFSFKTGTVPPKAGQLACMILLCVYKSTVPCTGITSTRMQPKGHNSNAPLSGLQAIVTWFEGV
jgi:hypothetical protein